MVTFPQSRVVIYLMIHSAILFINAITISICKR